MKIKSEKFLVDIETKRDVTITLPKKKIKSPL